MKTWIILLFMMGSFDVNKNQSSVEQMFLNNYGFLSSYTFSDGHGVTPQWIEDYSNKITLIYINTVSNFDSEIIYDYICKLNNGIYMYLQIDKTTLKYKLKLFFEPQSIQETKFLIKRIKNNNNGNKSNNVN